VYQITGDDAKELWYPEHWVDERQNIWYIIFMNSRSFITTKEELESILVLSDSESRWFSMQHRPLPLRISRYYLDLIDPENPDDPLRRQVVPSADEAVVETGVHLDPLAEVRHSVLPRLIHRYENRVAFLLTDRCATYCRHCFRRRFTAGGGAGVSDDELTKVLAYIEQHTEIREMLLTGGDPLMLSDTRLEHVLSALRAVRSDLVLRLCTRMPATYPFRVTDALVAMLAENTNPALYLMTQFNHVREITPESIDAVSKFVDSGIPVMNQTVLLRGVNDDVQSLEQLMNRLVSIRVKPYYLFQGDLVGGTHHLRVPLEHGLDLERQLRRRLSGLAMPTYAIDLPDGGGKVPLGSSYLHGLDASGAWEFFTVDGETRRYPDPEQVETDRDAR